MSGLFETNQQSDGRKPEDHWHMLVHELTLRGILSFGPDTPPLALKSLNVLIGPNGSGKSNLIESIGLLRSSAAKLTAPIRGVGGGNVSDWIWKGGKSREATLQAVLENPPDHRKRSPTQPLRHSIAFTEVNSRFEMTDEFIENQFPDPGYDDPFFFYRFANGNPILSVRGTENRRQLQRQDVAFDESILSQIKDPETFPELSHLATAYSDVRLYREWEFGRNSVFRSPQSADLPSGRLEEDFSNLGLFLNHLRGEPAAKRKIIEHLRDLYDGLDDFDVRIRGGTVEVFLTEGNLTIPASRLSDGTLRYLCLLAILCDPTPPSLVCIEEPELGMHPDMIPKIAQLMISASELTQLIVTTHSDILVDAMTERPDAIVVVEKRNGMTELTRLQANDEMKSYLESYRLGELWTRGFVGGTRW